jgi:hypothetical protein
VAVKFDVAKADLTFEAGFGQPEFALFRDTPGLLRHLFKRLEPHGIRLVDMKIERGSGSAADFHVLCYLFNFVMTVRVRLDRIEVYCADLPRDHVQEFSVAILDALAAVQAHLPDLSFRAHALAVGLHGLLEGEPVRKYISRFVSNAPNIGSPTGNGVVFYFGPEGDRLLSAITLDMSVVVPDALYVRTHVIWDAKKVEIKNLASMAEGFVRHVLNQVGLELPQ